MIVCSMKQLALNNFKNITSLRLQPQPGLNILLGDNGLGKTNILEAIALATCLKSFKTGTPNSEFIRRGTEQAQINADFTSAVNFEVSLFIRERNKQLKISGKSSPSSATLRQQLALVSFVPDDLNIVLGSSAYRRRALDQLSSSLFPSYADAYRRYDKALLSRNRLLKNMSSSAQELAAYTQILAEAGELLVQKRLIALELIAEIFHQQLLGLSGGALTAKLSYQSSCGPISLLSYLTLHHQQERARKTTLAGPHLDDLLILLNHSPSRRSASRGQARCLVLAWKIAHLLSVISYRELSPILILDDVVGELDPGNATRLMELVNSLATQTFISTTHLAILPAALHNSHLLPLTSI